MKFNIKFPFKLFGHNLRIAVAIVASLLITVFVGNTLFTNSPRLNYSYISTVPTRLVDGIRTVISSVKITWPTSASGSGQAVNQTNQSIFTWFRPVAPTSKPLSSYLNPTPTSENPTGNYPQPTLPPNVPTNYPQPTKTPTNIPTRVPQPTVQPTSPPNVNCPAVSSESYNTAGVGSPQPGAENNPDVNVFLRGFGPSGASLGLVTLGYPAGSPPDSKAPQLNTVLNNGPRFSHAYKIHQWNWSANQPSSTYETGEVHAIGITSNPNQNVNNPNSGYDIGGGYKSMVVFATPTSITLTVSSSDTTIDGYSINIDEFCVDPNLLNLYRQMNSQGRRNLPVIRGGQKIGVASGGEVRVIIRDTGQFMDPRSRLDWWQGF